MRTIPTAIKTLLKSKSMIGGNSPAQQVTFLDKEAGATTLQAQHVWVSREEAAISQRCTVALENVNPTNPKDPGYYMPYRVEEFTGQTQNEWHFQIIPGKRIQVALGYGTELVEAFTGAIDEATFNATPSGYTVDLDCRDLGWKLIDVQMTTEDPDDPYYVEYYDLDVSEIVRAALIAAGFASETLVIDTSGVMLDIEFIRQTYADLIEWAVDVTGFQFYISETGIPHFIQPTDKYPNAENESHMCVPGVTITLHNKPVIENSQVVKSALTGGTTYEKDIDYSIDYALGTITPLVGGGMPSDQTFYVTYVFSAWTFKNGEDIFNLTYSLTRRNQYSKIIVEGEGCIGSWEKPTAYWDTHEIAPNVVLFVNKAELLEDEECEAMATKLAIDMQRRYGPVEFAAVAVPWLQVGDCIQVIEYSSTVSEIYKIVSLELDYTTTGSTMLIRCYHFGYGAIS